MMISGLYGAATYSYKGRVELMAASSCWWGRPWAPRSARWPPSTSKAMASASPSACAVIGCALSIILKMLAKGIPAYGGLFNGAATVLILGLVSAMSIYIFVRMIAGARRELAAKKSGAQVSIDGG